MRTKQTKTYKKRNLVYVFLALIGVLICYLIWYNYQYSMDRVTPFEVNSPSLEQKVLIASQGSEFKNTVVNNLIKEFNNQSIYFKIIDVHSLPNINIQDWNALVIIHTWENWKPPKVVKNFIEENSKELHKCIVFTTSGEGSYKIDEVDAITGESTLEQVPSKVTIIKNKLITILDQS